MQKMQLQINLFVEEFHREQCKDIDVRQYVLVLQECQPNLDLLALCRSSPEYGAETANGMRSKVAQTAKGGPPSTFSQTAPLSTRVRTGEAPSYSLNANVWRAHLIYHQIANGKVKGSPLDRDYFKGIGW